MQASRHTLKTVFAVAAAVLTALVFAPAALAAPPEEPTTEPVLGFTATTATLFGVLSPNAPGEPGGTYEFLYKASSTITKAECESPEALKAPEPAGAAGEGQAEPVALEVGALTPGTEYVVCLVETNAASEAAVGSAVAFKTALPPEEPEAQPASEVEGTTATLHGVLNPNGKGDPGTYEFLYSPSASECQAEGEATSPAVASLGNEGEEVEAKVTGLVGGTTYTFCLLARNGAGEAAVGPAQTFETAAEKPVVVSQSTSGVTPFAATLQAEVNPENQTATSCVFEYGKVVTDNKLPCEQIELAGSSTQTVTRALAGLEPGTKYHFRVVVKNATGETKGAEEEFETAAAEGPAIVSETVSGITPNQARLEGVLNPNFQLTRCNFFYGPTAASENKLPCEPEFLEGFGEQGVGSTITGLAPETTYHYRILAKNAAGETEGKEEEFTTLPLEAPTVGSESVPFVSATDAQLEATINPHAQETTFSFEYATKESVVAEGKGTKVTSEAVLPAVFEEVATGPVDLGGALTPGTPYFYRVIAKNLTGETLGPIQEFSTSPPEPPIVGSESVSNVTETGATFEANINPNGTETTYSFEYATDEAFTENAGSLPGLLPLEPFVEELPTEAIQATGLEGETVYFYRVVATSATMGTTDGPTQQFKTLGKPGVTTGAAVEPTRTTAPVSGAVSPGGAQTSYRFVYVPAKECPKGAVSCAFTRGSSTASLSLFATGYSAEAVSPVTLEGLKPGTEYGYALVATNSTGTTVGPELTFETSPATPPIATTGGASGVSERSATIAGSVDTRGLASTIQFQIGSEPTNGTLVSATVTSQSGNTAQVAATFEGTLQPGTTYYYRVLASNSDGASEGAQATFKTAEVPVLTGPVTPALISYTPITTLNEKEAKENKEGEKKKPTKAQLLAKALKTCHKKHGSKRVSCERKARKKYGASKHGKKGG